MKNWLKQYRQDFAQAVLDVVWQTWTQAGILGDQRVLATGRIVDPEPLLLLTWECARQEPRIFDEVLDWLARNGRWINVVRLSTLLQADKVCPPALVGAVAAFMRQHDKSPKWRQLAERHRPGAEPSLAPLFQRQGRPLGPLAGDQDETFARYGWARSRVHLRGQAQPLPAWTPTSLFLKSRAFFGVNIRADVFAWLVAHGHGTASELARELGYSQRRVAETLTEMHCAELFQTRADGYRKEYSLAANKGWPLLFEATAERADWFNWRAFGRAVAVVWRQVFALGAETTAYIFEAEIVKAVAEARDDFTAAGLPLSVRPGSSELLEKIQQLAPR